MMDETQHDQALPAIGEPFVGGYFAGLDMDNKRYAIVVAPKSSGHFAGVTWEQAQERCASVRAGNFKDWRLPTIGESEVVYCRLRPNFTTAAAFRARQSEAYEQRCYWTSTQFDSRFACIHDFECGALYRLTKDYDYCCRAIRKVLLPDKTTEPAPREIKSLMSRRRAHRPKSWPMNDSAPGLHWPEPR